MFVGMMLMTVLFARLVFLSADPNIHFSAADAAALHAANFQAHIERGGGV